MNTLIVVGVLLLTLGFVVFVGAGVLLLTKIALTPSPVARGGRPARSRQTPAPQADRAGGGAGPTPRTQARPERSLPPDPPATPLAPDPLQREDDDEDDDDFAHVSTGVLNLADFKDFEELVAAADNLIGKDKKE